MNDEEVRFYSDMMSGCETVKVRKLFATFIARNTPKDARVKKMYDVLYRMSRGKEPLDTTIAHALNYERSGAEPNDNED